MKDDQPICAQEGFIPLYVMPAYVEVSIDTKLKIIEDELNAGSMILHRYRDNLYRVVSIKRTVQPVEITTDNGYTFYATNAVVDSLLIATKMFQ